MPKTRLIGFRNFRGTDDQLARAKRHVKQYENVLAAELRLSSYCGPDSPGARGAATLVISTVDGPSIVCIEH